MLDLKGEKTTMEVKMEREEKLKEKHQPRQVSRDKRQQEWREMRTSGRMSQGPSLSAKLRMWAASIRE